MSVLRRPPKHPPWIDPESVFVDGDARTADEGRETASAPHHDRIVVIGGASRSLDLLRLAVIRSDDVVFFAERIDAATRRFIDRFAVEHRHRAAWGSDLAGAAAVLVAMGDISRENCVVRDARRRGVPVHVADRQLVSDFALLELFAAGPVNPAG